MSYNSSITDESILNLINGCGNLEDIDITVCDKLTDASLFSIAANCPNLQTINLRFDDTNITKVGLTELFKKCPKLTRIESQAKIIPKEIRYQSAE